MATVRREVGSWAPTVAAVIVGLNLFDCVMTLLFLRLGHCTEANPLMAALLRQSAWLFAGVKVALVHAGLLLLLQLRHSRVARLGLGAGLVAYLSVAALHLSFALRELRFH